MAQIQAERQRQYIHPAIKQKIVFLLKADVSPAVISEQFGIKESSIATIKSRHIKKGLPIRGIRPATTQLELPVMSTLQPKPQPKPAREVIIPVASVKENKSGTFTVTVGKVNVTLPTTQRAHIRFTDNGMSIEMP